MKKILYLALIAVLAGWLAAPSLAAAGGDVAVQSAKTTASAFELNMRILEGSRDKSSVPGRPVTASFLEFLTFANFEDEKDVATDEQIKKVFNLKDVSLLTEAPLVWEKGKADKAFHMFRINGQEYLVMVTPGKLPERGQFRIEVHEQGRDKKTSLLDTEFSLPEKTAAVFGFEDTKLKAYFITLRVTRWVGEPAGPAAVDVRGVLKGGGEKGKPPKLIKKVEPVYPEEARKAGVEGVVILEATTDTYGRIAAVKVLRGVPQLDQAAVDALKQWVYEPMVINGKPMPAVLTVTMGFKLDDKMKPAVSGAVGGVLKGGDEKVKPPKLIKEVKPVYPEEARKAGVEGVVIMEATTDTYGRVAAVKVLRGVPQLDQAAIDALKQWVYEPMVVDGKPRPVTFTVTMQFKLDDKKEPKVGVGGQAGGAVADVTGGIVGGMLTGEAGTQDLKEFEGDAVRAVGKIHPPKLIKTVEPVYPESARQARIEGVVILEAKVDEQGNVIGAKVLRSIKELDRAAIDAIKQWKYEPMVIDGKPRKVLFTVTVRFVLDEGSTWTALKKFASGAVIANKEVGPPKLIKDVDPFYPEAARAAGVQGVVILGVKTDEYGRVQDAVILRSIPLLDQAAIDAVRQWVYEPLIQDGKAVPVVFTVTVRFNLR